MKTGKLPKHSAHIVPYKDGIEIQVYYTGRKTLSTMVTKDMLLEMMNSVDDMLPRSVVVEQYVEQVHWIPEKGFRREGELI